MSVLDPANIRWLASDGDDLGSLNGELERERRSLAMLLPPSAYVAKDKAIELVRRCQAAIAAAQGRIG